MRKGLQKRYDRTLDFVNNHLDPGSRILDLGTRNAFSEILNESGYNVQNTQGEDLDIDFQKYTNTDVDVVTAFEIFEHMLAPFNILLEIKTDKLIASVP